METTAKNIKLWKNDPLLRLLKETLNFSGLRIVLLFVIIAAVVHFGLNWIADSFYTGSGIRFMEPKLFYYFPLVYTIIFTPFVLGFYVWQPGAFAEVLHSLEQAGVIQEVSEEEGKTVHSYPDFLSKFSETVDRKSWIAVSILLIIIFWMNEFLFAWPSEFNAMGRSTFWYDTKWLLGAHILNFSVWLYALWMIVLREVQAILYFNRLFQWFDVRIRPMHPDEAGGLGALGNFTMKTSLIAVGFGVIAVMYSIQILLTGDDPFTRSDVLSLWVLYILVTPLSLILPMLSAHRAMKEARDDKLNEIAQEFEKTLSDSSTIKTNDIESIKKANEKLSELQTRYKIVEASFPTWPIPMSLFRNFSITASLPMVSGLISMAINFATK